MKVRAILLAAFVSVLAGGLALADTVTLEDGTTLEGTVTVRGSRVTVETSSGTLTLPASRVASIQSGQSGAEQHNPPRATVQEQQPRAEGRAQPRQTAGDRGAQQQEESDIVRVADVLRRRIDVHFDGVPISEVLSYIQEVTGVNLVMTNTVRQSVEPVYLRLRDAPVETVLEFALEQHGFAYDIRPGEVLFIGEENEVRRYVMRVYPVMDLLVNRGDLRDVGLPGARDLGRGVDRTDDFGLGTGRDRGATRQRGRGGTGRQSGFSPQFGTGQPTGQAFTRDGRADTDDEMARRAGNLILLMKQTCGYGTWRDPNWPGILGTDDPGIGQ